MSAQRPLEPAADGPDRPDRSDRAGPVTLRAGTMSDLLQVVPYLLGFHAHESLVALLMRGRRIMLTARVDLGPAVAGLAQQVARITRRHGADRVVLVAYSDSAPRARRALRSLLDDARMPMVVDAVHVDGDRYRSVIDDETGSLGAGRLAAEAVYAGLGVVGDRAAAVSVADPPDPERLVGLAGLTETIVGRIGGLDAASRVERTVELIRRHQPCRSTPPDADLVSLGVLVDDVAARDAAIALVGVRSARSMMRLWSAVVAVTPAPYERAPLCLLALSGWLAGNGALLVRCVERLEALDPDYRMTQLLAGIADDAVPPTAWEGMVGGLVQSVPAGGDDGGSEAWVISGP